MENFIFCAVFDFDSWASAFLTDKSDFLKLLNKMHHLMEVFTLPNAKGLFTYYVSSLGRRSMENLTKADIKIRGSGCQVIKLRQHVSEFHFEVLS